MESAIITDSVLLLSGGLDSLVLLANEVYAGRKPVCVSFDYGQRHRGPELEAALAIADRYGVDHQILDLPYLGGSALTDILRAVPKGLHYAAPGQRATVVPNRNAVMLSVAASLAAAFEMRRVLFAAHAGDRDVYADCRETFVRLFSEATEFACGVRVEAPFLTRTKREVVLLGRSLGVDFDLSWSCYDPQDGKPCLACGACCERMEALA